MKHEGTWIGRVRRGGLGRCIRLFCGLAMAYGMAEADGLADTAPSIIVQLTNQFSFLSTQVVFSVVASGTPPPSYQWSFNGIPIPGATGSNYSVLLTNVVRQTGRYKVLVSNSAGSVSSTVAVLHVRELLRFLTSQASQSLSNDGLHMGVTGVLFPNVGVLESSSNLASWTPLYTNFIGGSNFNFVDAAATNRVQSFYRIRERLPLGSFAVLANGPIDSNGNNFTSDSFDSRNPLYSTGGLYDATKRKARGDIATNSHLTNSSYIGDAEIRGHIYIGLDENISIGPNGSVGDLAWGNSGHYGIQAGYAVDHIYFDFPDAPVPPSGGVALPGNNILGNGSYEVDSLILPGNSFLTVNGTNTTLYVRGNLSLSGNGKIVLSPGCRLTLYVGGSADFGGNGILNPGSAPDFCYYGLAHNTSLVLQGNAALTGVFYAPHADISLGAASGGSQELVGALVGKSVLLNGHWNFHYDEVLGRMGPLR